MNEKIYDASIDLDKLKNIVDTFVNTMADDVMIGFFFKKSGKNRIKKKEFEFLANFLGFDISYTGKPIGQAHKKHRIMGGQFSRRKQILKETLEKFEVSPNIIESIMEHTEEFRVTVSKTRNSDCNHQTI